MILSEPALECLTSCKTGCEIEGRELRLAAWNRRLDEDIGSSEVDAVGLTETLCEDSKLPLRYIRENGLHLIVADGAAHGTICTLHTTHATALKTTTRPKTRCRKPYAAT